LGRSLGNLPPAGRREESLLISMRAIRPFR
jgi:hypothetical protein